jgi:hypothetical protein
MKRAFVAVAICAALLIGSLVATASADTVGRLTRRVNRLENRVERIQGLQNAFIGFFFACVVPNGAFEPIQGSDGQATTGQHLFVDSRCLGEAAARDTDLRKAFEAYR